MKLKSEFITHELDDKQVLIDTAGNFSGLARSNETAAFIVDCLKNDTTREDIVAAMLAEYDAQEEIIARDVDKIIEKLRGIGAIEE